jgi:hypothetical protein
MAEEFDDKKKEHRKRHSGNIFFFRFHTYLIIFSFVILIIIYFKFCKTLFILCVGRKAEKKDLKKKLDQDEASARKRNPKAFAINSVVSAQRRFRRWVEHLINLFIEYF